ncbi:MAG: hypothetical protein IIC49_00615 [Planctomycetes bacterium]|nr:hypothetical protein [Planctomycetota bacterium]
MSNLRHIQRVSGRSAAVAVIALGVLAALPASAAAQGAQDDPLLDLRPPRPKPASRAPIAQSLATAVVLAGAVVFVGVMPTKRGHQD